MRAFCLLGVEVGVGVGWFLEPKSPKVCVRKTSQINISFCKISFFPTMKSGSEGRGVISPPPPAPPTPGDAELLSKGGKKIALRGG